MSLSTIHLPQLLCAALLSLPAAAADPPVAPASEQPALPQAPQKSRRVEVRDRYRDLAEARDGEGLAELWRANEDLILVTIDEDLEGGLAIWEADREDPDQEAIDALFERALFGAHVAGRATGRVILHDYAAAFVGWDAVQRDSFRAGQRIYKRALDELAGPDIDPSGGEAMVAREVWERALALGDWWGAAMGFDVEGRAHQRGGLPDSAIRAYSQARILFNQLGLLGSELEVLRRMSTLCASLEQWPRAKAAAEDGLVLARRMGQAAHERELLTRRAEAERALGQTEAAAASERELEALGG